MKKISLAVMVMFSLLVMVALPGLVSASTSLTVVSPGTGTPGQTLSVTIKGTDLTGATAISFGSGFTTDNFTVDSSTKIKASITIAGSATIGARDVSVTTPSGVVTKADGFTVTQELPNRTNHSGQGIPFWVWIIVGAAAAVVVIGLGAYVIGRRRPAIPQQ